jgi:hypothetical protein
MQLHNLAAECVYTSDVYRFTPVMEYKKEWRGLACQS